MAFCCVWNSIFQLAQRLKKLTMQEVEALFWIRQTIEESEESDQPVTAILHISYSATDESQKNKTSTTEDLKKILLQKRKRAMSGMSAHLLTPGDCPRWFNQASSAQHPVYFVTYDTYSDLFKADVTKAFFRQFNAKHRNFGEIFFFDIEAT